MLEWSIALYFSKIDLAEFVLNRCITQTEDGLGRQRSIEGDDIADYSPVNSGVPEIQYNYAYLEDIAVQQNAHGQLQHQQSFLQDDEPDGPASQRDIESASQVTPHSGDNHVLKWMVCFTHTKYIHLVIPSADHTY